jgi:hypothetical protein
LAAIEAAGAEAVVADPNRLATLVGHLEGVSVMCWLMGTASGDPDAVAALHGPRLESILDTIIDTPVRAFVYEGAGTVDRLLLERGSGLVRGAAEAHRIPVEVVGVDPLRDRSRWLDECVAAVDRALSA